MNSIAEEILMHYGMPRRSGRYPWGSGEDPYQHGRDFIARVEELRKSNFTYTDENGKTWTGDNAIAKSMGLTSTQFRTELSLAKDERRMLDVARAKSLREDGLGYTEIGRQMGINESTVRSLLDENSEARMKKATEIANVLKERSNEVISDGGMIEVGVGVERELGVSKENLKKALYILEREGYNVYPGGIPQVTNRGQQINQLVLCPPGVEWKEIYDYSRVHSVKDYTSHDGGETFDKLQYPASMDSKRLMIRYADDIGPDGARGIDKDGIVEIRRGVDDLSLGGSHYSQVRILVDGKKYIKGMAVYSDDMPDGVDIVFNTNKKSNVSKMDVLKDIKDDPENPFGSLIKANGQSYYTDKDGNRKLSLINKRADEGDWDDWADALPSQFLSKQSRSLAKKQLDLAKADKMAEFEEIMSINNPTIKKHFLQKFSDECDSAAVHLKAAALPGQKYHVIIPINTLKDTEVYAPGYEDGTLLALVRYPHGGTFEIPRLTVNNKNKMAQKIIGNKSIDAVGINKNIADRLSGADFDGDTVMCIPTHDKWGKVNINSTKPLEGLKDFDPKDAYPERPGMRYMKDPKTGVDNTQIEMGVISNLITDMTLGGATEKELAAAVRHSMVVIDAAKHKLDYKRSEQENNIKALKNKYQVSVDKNGNTKTGGASTLISKAKSETPVNKRQGNPKINTKYNSKGELNSWYDPSKPEGSLIYKDADDLYYPKREYDKDTGIMTIKTTSGKNIKYNVNDKEAAEKYNPVKRVDEKTGEVTFTDKSGTIEYRKGTRTQKSTAMMETDDAYSLVSKAKHPMELIYADYANSMKDLANKARIEMTNTGKIAYSSSAKKTYSAEVNSLNEKLNTALLNAPREREAQRRANVEVDARIAADPTMKKSDIKKASQQAIVKYRNEVDAVARRDRNIDITDREWEAIQAGAVSETTLKKILNNADVDKLRERATPRASTTLSEAKINRIKAMSNSNHSLSDIAKALNISTSKVSEVLKGE